MCIWNRSNGQSSARVPVGGLLLVLCALLPAGLEGQGTSGIDNPTGDYAEWTPDNIWSCLAVPTPSRNVPLQSDCWSDPNAEDARREQAKATDKENRSLLMEIAAYLKEVKAVVSTYKGIKGLAKDIERILDGFSVEEPEHSFYQLGLAGDRMIDRMDQTEQAMASIPLDIPGDPSGKWQVLGERLLAVAKNQDKQAAQFSDRSLRALNRVMKGEIKVHGRGAGGHRELPPAPSDGGLRSRSLYAGSGVPLPNVNVARGAAPLCESSDGVETPQVVYTRTSVQAQGALMQMQAADLRAQSYLMIARWVNALVDQRKREARILHTLKDMNAF